MTIEQVAEVHHARTVSIHLPSAWRMDEHISARTRIFCPIRLQRPDGYRDTSRTIRLGLLDLLLVTDLAVHTTAASDQRPASLK